MHSLFKRSGYWILPIIVTALVQGGCARSDLSESATPQKPDLVIQGGYLLDMISDEPDARLIKGLVVRGGRIERILELGSSEVLPGSTSVIDGRGLYILPGFVDSHIHFRPWFPRPFIHYGVTTVMDTAPCPDCAEDSGQDPNEWILKQKESLAAPDALGPAMFVTGMKLDGPTGKKEPNVYTIRSLDEIAPRVQFLADLGVSGIKVEESLTPAFRRRVVEEAEKHNMPVVGHSREAQESIAAGMKFIEHMLPIARSLVPEDAVAGEHTMDLDRAPSLIELMIQNRVYLNPTLLARYGHLSDRAEAFAQQDAELLRSSLFDDVPSDVRAVMLSSFLRAAKMPEEQRRQAREGLRRVEAFVRDFSARGGLLLAGTDSIGGRVPGVSMQRELQLLVDAGVSPYKALLGATRLASDFMRMSDHIGTLQSGRQADIVILGANPVETISATEDIRYVMRRGVVMRGRVNDTAMTSQLFRGMRTLASCQAPASLVGPSAMISRGLLCT